MHIHYAQETYQKIGHKKIFKKSRIKIKDYVYDFITDYSAIDVDNIKDIHKYLIKKNKIEQYKNV